jgi:alpha-D-xyloside xylohydrolase
MHWIAEDCLLRCRLRAVCPAFAVVLAASSVSAQMPGQKAPGLPPAQIEQTNHGFSATAGKEVLTVTACTDSVIHVVATPNPSATMSPRPWMLDATQSCPGAQFTFTEDAMAVSIKTAQVEVIFDRGRGSLSFRTTSGESLLNEGTSMPRTYEPVELNGDHTYRVTERFSPSITEALYGLGQHQSGMFNYRGATVELGQNNTDVAIPLLISSKGYGLIWNTAALTYFDNRFPLEVKLTSIAGKSIDHSTKFTRSRNATVRSTSRSMLSCRTGSGGRPRAIRSSIPTTTT